MNKVIQLLFYGSFLSGLMACQTTQPTSYMQLDQYLGRFIGQSSDHIRSHIDFKALGYQVNATPENTDQRLSYTILRPINIPMINGSTAVTINSNGVPVIRSEPSSAQSYDIHFNCTVVFQLKNHIAQSVQYFGKAC